MKISASIFVLLLASTASAYATTLISLINSDVVIGFSDSSFNYQTAADIQRTKYCYNGFADDVCPQIQQAVTNKNWQYSAGDHDNIVDLTCKITSDTELVLAQYRLVDDYGSNYTVKRAISPCPLSSLL